MVGRSGFGLERGEQDHLADAGDAGEQHREPIDAQTHPARRWQAELECSEVVLVDRAGLGVARGAGARLGFEPRRAGRSGR